MCALIVPHNLRAIISVGYKKGFVTTTVRDIVLVKIQFFWSQVLNSKVSSTVVKCYINLIETWKGKGLLDFDNLLRQLIIGRSNQVTSDDFAD